MNDKVSAARRRAAFLRALSETGSVTLAAARAGGDRSGFYARRRRDAVFARGWDEALERARGRLAEGGAEPRGDDLVIWDSARGRPRATQIQAHKWTARAEGLFLAHLAATSNVTASCAAAGFSTTAVYQRRMKRPGFRDAWAEALDEGYARLEMMLVERATRAPDPAEPDAGPVAAGTAMTTGEAMNLLKLHKAATAGQAPRRGGGDAPNEPSIEEVRDEILRRLAAIRKQRERSGRGESE